MTPTEALARVLEAHDAIEAPATRDDAMANAMRLIDAEEAYGTALGTSSLVAGARAFAEWRQIQVASGDPYWAAG